MQSGFLTNTQSSGKRLFTPTTSNTPKKPIAFDRSLIALVSSWGGLICDTTIQINDFNTEIITKNIPPKIPTNGTWIQIIGKSNIGGFTIYLPTDAAAFILQLADGNLDISKLEGGDAALVFEYLFTYHLNLLENILEAELSIVSITDVDAPVQGELLGFEFDLEGETQQGALQVQGDLHHQIEGVVGLNSFPEDKIVEDRLIVHLGPVVVPSKQAYLARVGEMIDCGVEPSSTIKGVLMRSDRRYWPIYIEDELVEIAGELAGPIQMSNETTENVFVTFGLGEVSLSAHLRLSLSVGSKIQIQRIPNNGANIYYQARPFGQGHLSILGSNLSVTLDNIGAFKI